MYLEVLKHEEMFDLCFKTLNGNKKGMTQAVRVYTLTCKLRLMYLKVKLQQDRCRWWKLKCHKTAVIRYIEGNKQQRRYRLTYLDVSNLQQG